MNNLYSMRSFTGSSHKDDGNVWNRMDEEPCFTRLCGRKRFNRTFHQLFVWWSQIM